MDRIGFLQPQRENAEITEITGETKLLSHTNPIENQKNIEDIEKTVSK